MDNRPCSKIEACPAPEAPSAQLEELSSEPKLTAAGLEGRSRKPNVKAAQLEGN